MEQIAAILNGKNANIVLITVVFITIILLLCARLGIISFKELETVIDPSDPITIKTNFLLLLKPKSFLFIGFARYASPRIGMVILIGL